jgi:hypothetical protein
VSVRPRLLRPLDGSVATVKQSAQLETAPHWAPPKLPEPSQVTRAAVAAGGVVRTHKQTIDGGATVSAMTADGTRDAIRTGPRRAAKTKSGWGEYPHPEKAPEAHPWPTQARHCCACLALPKLAEQKLLRVRPRPRACPSALIGRRAWLMRSTYSSVSMAAQDLR